MNWIRCIYGICLVAVWIELIVVWRLIGRIRKDGKKLDELAEEYVKEIVAFRLAREAYEEKLMELRKENNNETDAL